MAVYQTQLGPGVLDIGEVGTLTNFATQVTAATLKPKTDEGDDIAVLSGDVVGGDITESWTLEGTLLQDFGHPDSPKSLSEWTFTNRGKNFPFVFTPNNTGNKKITGTIRISATDIGGDVKKRNTSDFVFKVFNPEIAAV